MNLLPAKKKRRHIYLDPALEAQAKQFAKQHETTFSAIVGQALRLYLDMYIYNQDPLQFLKKQREQEGR